MWTAYFDGKGHRLGMPGSFRRLRLHIKWWLSPYRPCEKEHTHHGKPGSGYGPETVPDTLV